MYLVTVAPSFCHTIICVHCAYWSNALLCSFSFFFVLLAYVQKFSKMKTLNRICIWFIWICTHLKNCHMCKTTAAIKLFPHCNPRYHSKHCICSNFDLTQLRSTHEFVFFWIERILFFSNKRKTNDFFQFPSFKQ